MAASGKSVFFWLIVAVLAVVGLVVVLPLVFSVVGWVLFVAVPVLLLIAGIVSCATSNKTVPLKVLWLLVIFLAPLLGPLLWFFWGKKNT